MKEYYPNALICPEASGKTLMYLLSLVWDSLLSVKSLKVTFLSCGFILFHSTLFDTENPHCEKRNLTEDDECVAAIGYTHTVFIPGENLMIHVKGTAGFYSIDINLKNNTLNIRKKQVPSVM